MNINIYQALSDWQRADPTRRFPHEFHPTHMPPRASIESMDEAGWLAFAWNPPAVLFAYLPDRFPSNDYSHLEFADPLASPKPTWAELVAALDFAAIRAMRGYLPHRLRAVCQRMITAVYLEPTLADETCLRLRVGAMLDQDAERDRLRAKYLVYKAFIATAGRAELEALDFENDAALWLPVTVAVVVTVAAGVFTVTVTASAAMTVALQAPGGTLSSESLVFDAAGSVDVTVTPLAGQTEPIELTATGTSPYGEVGQAVIQLVLA